MNSKRNKIVNLITVAACNAVFVLSAPNDSRRHQTENCACSRIKWVGIMWAGLSVLWVELWKRWPLTSTTDHPGCPLRLCFHVARGTARTQSPLPKIMRPNQPRFAEVADVSNPRCNGKPPSERAPFMIRASQAPSKYELFNGGVETLLQKRLKKILVD